MTLIARWTRIVRTVTFDASGGSVNPNTLNINSGDAIGNLPTPTREHHVFDGWFSGGSQANRNTIISADITLTAQWTPLFLVTFNYANGSVSENSRRVLAGDEIGSLPTTERDHYTFSGWFNGGSEVTSSTVVNEDIALTAHWNLNDWTAWSSNEPPAGTPASYREKQYGSRPRVWTTRNTNTLSGWTIDNSRTTWVWSEYGNWSDWSTSWEIASDSREIGIRTVIVSPARTEWRFGRYSGTNVPNGGSPFHWCLECGKGLGGTWNVTPVYTNWGTDPGRLGGQSCGFIAHGNSVRNYSYLLTGTTSNHHFREERHIAEVNRLEFRYRDRHQIFTFHFWQWGNWSDWQTAPITRTNDLDVREQYRYRPK
jgi:uncharacterized repeat protein (TIGR02543 family)